MALQDSVTGWQIPTKRTLYDYSIFTNGSESRLIRLHITEDRYGDQTVEIIDSSTITAFIDNLDQIPLSKYRFDITRPNQSTQTNKYLFDVLPLKGFFQSKEYVQIGDFVIKKMISLDDISIYLVMEIQEHLGNFEHGYQIWNAYDVAIYNGILSQEVKNEIENYKM